MGGDGVGRGMRRAAGQLKEDITYNEILMVGIASPA